MFSYFYSAPEEPAYDPSTPYPELGPEYNADKCFEQLNAAFEDKDGQAWEIQVDEPGFIQHWCWVDGTDNLAMRAR